MLNIDIITIASILSALAVIYGIVVKIAKQFGAVTHGIKSMLRYRIVHECSRVVNRSWVTSIEIEDLTDLYEAYHAVGGNGSVTKFYTEAIGCRRVTEAEADRLRQEKCYYKLALKMLEEQKHE